MWVIAETTDLPTRYIKEVVTDDHGRYLIPDLPKAKYTVWARGYGLVDSPKVRSRARQAVESEADRRAGQERPPRNYYPGQLLVRLARRCPRRTNFPARAHRQRHFAERQKPGRSGSI